jgi:hypothetical protein
MGAVSLDMIIYTIAFVFGCCEPAHEYSLCYLLLEVYCILFPCYIQFFYHFLTENIGLVMKQKLSKMLYCNSSDLSCKL